MMVSLSFATLSVVFGFYLIPLVLPSALSLAATDWILSSGDAARSKVEKCWFFVVVNVRKKGVETIGSFGKNQSCGGTSIMVTYWFPSSSSRKILS